MKKLTFEECYTQIKERKVNEASNLDLSNLRNRYSLLDVYITEEKIYDKYGGFQWASYFVFVGYQEAINAAQKHLEKYIY